MSRSSEEIETELGRLREQARNGESRDVRQRAILRIAKLDWERNAEIYEKLARE